MTDNVFRPENDTHYHFTWDKLGNIEEGRQNMGVEMPVAVYRLMEYCINHVLYERYGAETANDIFREAGLLAGKEFAKNVLPLKAQPQDFLSALQTALLDLKVGILRMETADFEKGEFTITVHEDLDCSGLPPTNELVCNYDEGFIAGILETYVGKPFHVREVDCWANGERVCRFKGRPLTDERE